MGMNFGAACPSINTFNTVVPCVALAVRSAASRSSSGPTFCPCAPSPIAAAARGLDAIPPEWFERLCDADELVLDVIIAVSAP